MSSLLDPVLANTVMTELEETIVKKFIDSGIIRFYCRYVDGTLHLIKSENVKNAHRAPKNFDPSTQFTVDTFENEVAHFLDVACRSSDNFF